MLSGFDTRISLYHAERIPQEGPLLIVSNHRSFMDPLLLMVALDRTIRFACHRYMAQVPVLKDVVQHMGGFALEPIGGQLGSKHRTLVDSASQLFAAGDAVGIFPEGAQPMVHCTAPDHLGAFHRGFAHLLLRSPIQTVTVLPIAIASRDESIHFAFPVRLLHWVDPSEPQFDQNGWHPVVIYHNVNVMVGHPITITVDDQQSYRGHQGRLLSCKLTRQCQDAIGHLLKQGLKL